MSNIQYNYYKTGLIIITVMHNNIKYIIRFYIMEIFKLDF